MSKLSDTYIKEFLQTPEGQMSLKKEAFKRSYYEFFKYFWGVVESGELADGKYIKYLCDKMQEVADKVNSGERCEYDLLINIPPAMSKSSISNKFFHPWYWACRDPSAKFLCVAKDQGVAKDHANKSMEIIESVEYRELFPDVYIRNDANSKELYRNNHGGIRMSKATGSKGITGMHGHFIIVDDPLDATSAKVKTDRQKAKTIIRETLPSRKIDGGCTIYIFQRLHEDDPAKTVLSMGTPIKHICLPAELNETASPIEEVMDLYTNGLLDPLRLSSEALTIKRADLGRLAYSTQYNQKTKLDDNNLWKSVWFEHTFYEDQLGDNDLTMNLIIDGAFTADPNNDPTGLMFYKSDFNTKINYIYHAEKVRMEPTELVKYIKSICYSSEYGFNISKGKVLVEAGSSGSGQAILSIMQANCPEIHADLIPYINVETDTKKKPRAFSKMSKTNRAESVSGQLEQGRFMLNANKNWDDFIEECIGFPQEKNDEYVDLTVYVLAMNFYNAFSKGLKKDSSGHYYFSTDVNDSDAEYMKRDSGIITTDIQESLSENYDNAYDEDGYLIPEKYRP